MWKSNPKGIKKNILKYRVTFYLFLYKSQIKHKQKNTQHMKKLLIVLVLGAFVACNESASTDAASDSTGTMVDTTTAPMMDTVTPMVDTTAATIDTLPK